MTNCFPLHYYLCIFFFFFEQNRWVHFEWNSKKEFKRRSYIGIRSLFTPRNLPNIIRSDVHETNVCRCVLSRYSDIKSFPVLFLFYLPFYFYFSQFLLYRVFTGGTFNSIMCKIFIII